MLFSTIPNAQVQFDELGCVTFNGVGTITVVDGNANAQRYIDIIDEHLWPVVARHYPRNDYIFQDDNAPIHRAHAVHAGVQIAK
jgi:hypothetical protein